MAKCSQCTRLKKRVAELQEALAPFALFASAVRKHTWYGKPLQGMDPVVSHEHQALVASAFFNAQETMWKGGRHAKRKLPRRNGLPKV